MQAVRVLTLTIAVCRPYQAHSDLRGCHVELRQNLDHRVRAARQRSEAHALVDKYRYTTVPIGLVVKVPFGTQQVLHCM